MCYLMKSAIITFVIFETICRAPYIDCSGSPTFQVKVYRNGSYSLVVNNVVWLNSGDTAFRADGKVYSLSDGSLKLIGTAKGGGSDKFGPWSSTIFLYKAGKSQINATVKVYEDSKVPAAIFTQTYLDTAEKTATTSAKDVISKFPSFGLKPPGPDLGFLAYAGYMAGYSNMLMGKLPDMKHVLTGTKGGPVVLFDNSSNALVISPASQFMATSNEIDTSHSHQISWGIMGLVNTVPVGYSADFIVYYSSQGINQAVQSWGNYMTTLYQKSTANRDNDLTIHYLGYWTDNGAFYYYNTEKSKNYETTIIDVVNYIHEVDIPFKYLQFDSWWYLKGEQQGTKTWEPQSTIFPDGFRYLYEKTKLPIGCHNKFWDGDTTYAKYNGGPFNFIRDSVSGLAVPDDSKFWPYLFNTTQNWGKFILYEQDWLNRETDDNAVMLNDLFMAQRWLQQMGRGAEQFGTISIQYCTSYSRHMLQALEIPVVTQARVSRDYQPGNRQWNIGITSLFSDSLNIAPFKDTFWTSEKQPGNTYNLTEPHTRLQALISTLSTGPVGPGDEIGYINKSLLMRCCDADGLILKPAKPATAIDDQIKRAAFKSPYAGPDGEVYTTYTVCSGIFFGIVVAANLSNDYSLTPASAWPTTQFPTSLAFSAKNPKKLFQFSSDKPIKLSKECSVKDFCLYYTSTLLKLDSGETFAVLGELDKWVPMSHLRVNSIQQTGLGIFVQIMVQAKEVVTFTYYAASQSELKTVVCDNSKSSTPALSTLISIPSGTCTVA